MTIAPHELRSTYPVSVATRTVFFIACFAMSVWAPLGPFAKAWLAINDASLGLLLLCLGIGSLLEDAAGGALGRTGWAANGQSSRRSACWA